MTKKEYIELINESLKDAEEQELRRIWKVVRAMTR